MPQAEIGDDSIETKSVDLGQPDVARPVPTTRNASNPAPVTQDFRHLIYYDWSGDGVWDHVAVVAGSNSAGQKVIDAHTTDHYRVYWKLGYSGTRYRYARVRPQWVV